MVLLESNMQETGLTSQLRLHAALSIGPQARGRVVVENPPGFHEGQLNTCSS